MTGRLLFLGIFALLLGAPSLPGQVDGKAPVPGADRRLLDGVAAVVGNDVVLYSDVQQQLALMAQQTPSLDPSDAKLKRQTLEAMIDERLVLVRAEEDSIVVSEEEVARGVDYQLQRIIQQLGSEKRLEEVYGMPIRRIKIEAHDIIRRQMLIERARQARFSGLKLTDHDVQEFYVKFRDSLPPVPDQVELQRIVLKAKPSSAAKLATMNLAKAIIDSIKSGRDFGDFAKRYSRDPGSATNGGDLGYNDPSKFVKEFGGALKRLRQDQISDPVETQFGIHIIQLIDKRSDGTVRARHILLSMTQPASERDSTIALLKSIRLRAQAGEDFASLAKTYSEDDDTRSLGGSLGKVPSDQLPADMKRTIGAMKEGEITEPELTTISQTESGFQIIRLARRIPVHKLDPVDDRTQLERIATSYKQRIDYANWVADLRREIYWEIKADY